jgi:hypothetical protein
VTPPTFCLRAAATGLRWTWEPSAWREAAREGVVTIMTANLTPVTPSADPPPTPRVDRTGADAELHDRAVKRLKAKAEFRVHLLIYALFNGMFVLIWAMTGANFFWPVFPIGIWGIGLVAHAMDVYWRHEPTESEIASEMDRLRSR